MVLGGDGNNAEVSCAGPSSEALLPMFFNEEAMAFHLQSNLNLGIGSETYNTPSLSSNALQADTSGNGLPILFLKLSM